MKIFKRTSSEWANNVFNGRTFEKPVPRSLDERIVKDYTEASYEPPDFKTRTSLRNYLYYRNFYRFRRLEKDMAWAKRQLERIDCNPEDARFLI